MTAAKHTLWGVEGDNGRWPTQAECVIHYLEMHRMPPFPRTLKLRAYQQVKPKFPKNFGGTVLRQTLNTIRERYDTDPIEPTVDMVQAADRFLAEVAGEALPSVAPPLPDRDPVEVDIPSFVERFYPEWIQSATYTDATDSAGQAQED